MLDKLINLDQLLRDVQNGNFDNVLEVRKEFAGVIRLTHEYKRRAEKAFHTQSSCTHQSFNTPTYHLNRNFMGEHYYSFKKVCDNCGKSFHHSEPSSWDDKSVAPDGYEGAVKVCYNLDI